MHCKFEISSNSNFLNIKGTKIFNKQKILQLLMSTNVFLLLFSGNASKRVFWPMKNLKNGQKPKKWHIIKKNFFFEILKADGLLVDI